MRRGLLPWLVALAVVAIPALAVPALARADGDPASDVLLAQSAFVPADAGASSAQLQRLDELVGAAARAGFPIRVAVIASASDLGSVSALWQHPRSYARFLALEVALAYGGRVLVAMPDGFGLARGGPPEQPALARLRAPGAGSALLDATASAVIALAAAAGHRLTPIAGPLHSAPGGSSPASLSWLVLGLGAALIALAWTASLRAQPPRRRGRPVAG